MATRRRKPVPEATRIANDPVPDKHKQTEYEKFKAMPLSIQNKAREIAFEILWNACVAVISAKTIKQRVGGLEALADYMQAIAINGVVPMNEDGFAIFPGATLEEDQ